MKMRSDTPLDYAEFQLSPKRTRCELIVSGEGRTEKLASGLVKPFVSHLKAAEEQVAQAVPSIKLEVERLKNVGTWFSKGTLERFVRFVSTPEVLELVNTFDAEMSQLESARRIYSQGASDHVSASLESEVTEAATDSTKKELLRAIDVRFMAVKQDLTTACARASSAGFTLDNVSELLLFADRFGAHRLNEACSKFLSLCQRRPLLIKPSWNGIDDRNVRSSSGSDMSLDDDPVEDYSTTSFKSSVSHHEPDRHCGEHLQDSSPSTQLLKPIPSPQIPAPSVGFVLRRSASVACSDRNQPSKNEGTVEKEAENIVDQLPSISQQQPARRLSVQDRINMFENKQKEQTGGGVKVVVGKTAELRRMSSDVGSAGGATERAVLRRWSGASDMSIDLNNDKKENEQSDCGTPSSSSCAQAPVSSNSHLIESDDSRLKDTVNSQDTPPSTSSYLAGPHHKFKALLKDQSQAAYHIQSRNVSGGDDDSRSKDQVASSNQFRALSSGLEQVKLRDQNVSSKVQVGSCTQFREIPAGSEQVKLKGQSVLQTDKKELQSGAEYPGSTKCLASQQLLPKPCQGCVEDGAAKGTDFSSQKFIRSFVNRFGDVDTKDRPISNASFNSKTEEVGSKMKDPLPFEVQLKPSASKVEGFRTNDSISSQGQHGEFAVEPEEAAKTNLVGPPSHWKNRSVKNDGIVKKGLVTVHPQLGGSFSAAIEELGSEGVKLNRQTSVPEHGKKLPGRSGDGVFPYANGGFNFSGKKDTESREVFDSAAANSQEVQKPRPSKGNQELNEELQLKANELEKLFAAHKLRVPGDLATSFRRGKMIGMQAEQDSGVQDKKSGASPASQLFENKSAQESVTTSNAAEIDMSLLMKMVDNQDYSEQKQKFSDFGSLEDSRGIFYERYMQKREAKLKEECVLKRSQKEAKMKAMEDSLERSRAELKAKFDASANDSAQRARCRVEKLRSFNFRAALKNKKQQAEDCFLSEEDEDQPVFCEPTPLGDGSSRNTNPKRISHNRSLSSSTPRTFVSPLPRSSLRTVSSSFGRRRTQTENPLAQSVPNFSDLRKENTKPSAGVSKPSTRSQQRNYARSRSSSEEIILVKEEKPRRSQSMRKNSAGTVDLNEALPLNLENAVLTPLRFPKEHTEQSLYNKNHKNGGSKSFPRRGNGVGLGSGVGIGKQKASVASEITNNEEESEDQGEQLEESADYVKVEEEDAKEEFEEVMNEAVKSESFSGGYVHDKQLSHESEKSGDLGSENCEVLRSLSQVDEHSAAMGLATVSSKFNMPVGSVQDSPGECPASWMHHSFSYAHETSDVDASVDSPIGSPASWNSRSLTQMMESDAARMRKKWGSAQKPIVVANSSSQQSRKDVTRGFKRLLKFGRKSRGAESLISDWVSASTASEGDDDTEDGRDPANRSSEDLRKSRMGFIPGPAYDSFNEGEIFNEQVQGGLQSSIPAPPANFKLTDDHLSGSSLKAPRSFFSLSSFRSKGSESKAR